MANKTLYWGLGFGGLALASVVTILLLRRKTGDGLTPTFTVSPTPAFEGDSVTFVPSVEGGSPVWTKWDFGDGTYNEVPDGEIVPTSHVYLQEGSYTATYTVEYEDGTRYATEENIVVKEFTGSGGVRIWTIHENYGTPVSGVHVQIEDQSGTIQASGQSDAKGYYEIMLPHGTYIATCVKSGYKNYVIQNVVPDPSSYRNYTAHMESTV